MDLNTDYSNLNHPLGDADPVTVNNLVIGEIPSFAQGFARLILLERALKASIDLVATTAEGPHSAAVIRLLGDHCERMSDEIKLLSNNCEILPIAAPFGQCDQSPRSLPKSEEVLHAEGQNGLKEIIVLHTNLISAMEAMRVAQPHDLARNMLLKELAQNHEEMSWMLTALLNEDKTARRREILAAEDVAMNRDSLLEGNTLENLSDS